ncbi:MAG: hypothetical protein KDH09_19145 [Chrysiogenetes bacterium]|nr:hypothetical protein [Chrysiogenetes bacterium]
MSVVLAVLVSTCAAREGAVHHEAGAADARSWMDNAVVIPADSEASGGADGVERKRLDETVIGRDYGVDAADLGAAELLKWGASLEDTNVRDAIGFYTRAYNTAARENSPEAREAERRALEALPRLKCLRFVEVFEDPPEDLIQLQGLIKSLDGARLRTPRKADYFGPHEAGFHDLSILCPVLVGNLKTRESRYVAFENLIDYLNGLADQNLFAEHPQPLQSQVAPFQLQPNQVAYEMIDGVGRQHVFVFEEHKNRWFWQGYAAYELAGLELKSTEDVVRSSGTPVKDTPDGAFEYGRRELEPYQHYRCRLYDSDIDLSNAETRQYYLAVEEAYNTRELPALESASRAFLTALGDVQMAEWTRDDQQWRALSLEAPTLEQWVTGHNPYLGEPPLELLQADEAYRVEIIPTFSGPVVVRAERSGSRRALTVKRMSGMGGYYYGELCRRVEIYLSESEFESIRSCFARPEVWKAMSDEGTDGSIWSLDALIDGRFNEHSVWSPTEGPLHECAMKLLKLSGFSERLIQEL